MRHGRRTDGAQARILLLTVLVGTALALLPDAVSAQYFGRNKVQYDDFDFRILRTEHFDFH